MSQIRAWRRAEVGADSGDGSLVAEAPDIVLHHLSFNTRARADQLGGLLADPTAGIGSDHVLGDAAPGGQEEPLAVRRDRREREVAQDILGRHDVQDREPGHGAWVVQHQSVRGTSPAVMADHLEGLETQPAYQADLVAGHGPLGVDQAGSVRIGLAGVAVAAQVGQHDRVVFGQSRGPAQAWPTQAGACQAVVEYIARYNGTRLHSTLGYRSPADFKNDDHGKLRNVA